MMIAPYRDDELEEIAALVSAAIAERRGAPLIAWVVVATSWVSNLVIASQRPTSLEARFLYTRA